MIPLQGTHIRLRAPEPEDLQWLYLWENQPDVWMASDTLVPFSRYHLRKYLEEMEMDPFKTRQIRFMIDLCKDPGTPVGTIDLFDFDPHHMRAGIGILVASTTQRRRGYASDALSTLLNYCRDVLMLHQVYCHIQASNQASQRLFGGCGFVQSGTLQQWVRTPQGWEDQHIMQLILRP